MIYLVHHLAGFQYNTPPKTNCNYVHVYFLLRGLSLIGQCISCIEMTVIWRRNRWYQFDKWTISLLMFSVCFVLMTTAIKPQLPLLANSSGEKSWSIIFEYVNLPARMYFSAFLLWKCTLAARLIFNLQLRVKILSTQKCRWRKRCLLNTNWVLDFQSNCTASFYNFCNFPILFPLFK